MSNYDPLEYVNGGSGFLDIQVSVANIFLVINSFDSIRDSIFVIVFDIAVTNPHTKTKKDPIIAQKIKINKYRSILLPF